MRRIIKHRFFPLACIGLVIVGAVLGAIYLEEGKKGSTSKGGAGNTTSKHSDDTIYNKSLLNIQSTPVEKTSRAKKSFMPKLGPKKKEDSESTNDTTSHQINEGAQLGHFSRARKEEKVREKAKPLLGGEDFYEDEEPLMIPFGRMLKCELVNAIDSTNINTPIVGLLMEPLWIDGVLVFPAGTEIHGKASADKVHARITSASEWVAVFPPNFTKYASKTVKLSGFALDREDRTGEGKTFGIADGSFGIRGYRIQSML